MGKAQNRYLELGLVLRRWRSELYRTALDFHESAQLKIKYGAYAAFERGESLPSPEELLQIARALQKDPEQALFLWAQVQMPDPESRSWFSPERAQAERRRVNGSPSENSIGSISSNQIPPSRFDNTWVFNTADLKIFLRDPFWFEILIYLAMIYPQEATFEELGYPSSSDQRLLLEGPLSEWIKQERVAHGRQGLRLTLPYIHLPKNEAFQPVRSTLLKRTLQHILPELTPAKVQAQESHRTVVHRLLTPAESAYWCRRLGELEMEFYLATANKGAVTGRKAYAFVSFLAPRKVPSRS